MSARRDSGLQDSTVLMFTADHGDLVMEQRQFYKMSMPEGSSHDPLLVMGPGVKSDQQLSLPGSLVDLYPTLLGEDWEAGLHSPECGFGKTWSISGL